MGGAFVAVADDASAVYWNPAGLASGAFFSVVLDRNTTEADRGAGPLIGSESSTFLALAVPALGITYYRLRATSVTAPVVPPDVMRPPPLQTGELAQVSSLITHQAGVTLVQSLTDTIAVGTTLKLVHGIAAAGIVSAENRQDVLDDAGGLVGAGSTEFDADIGVMAVAGALRAGLTVRNVREPEFETRGEEAVLRLHRQVRAGVAYTAASGILLSADIDLRSVPGTRGPVRNVAAGAETRVLRRLAVRGGFRINTRDVAVVGRTPVGTAGFSYAAMGSILVDGQVTVGGEQADRGWGLGVRVLF